MVNKHYSLFRFVSGVFVVVLTALSCEAQLMVQNVMFDGSMIGPTTLFRVAIHNSEGPLEVVFGGSLKDSGNQEVIAFRTKSFVLNSGTSIVSAADLTMASFNYASTELGRYAGTFNRLPGGRYTLCVEVTSGAEGTDKLCETEVVEEFIFLDLVQPWNGDTIDEVRPALSWNVVGSGPILQDADIRLVLSPMGTRGTPAQALAAERPLFTILDLTERVAQFPVGVQDLERGKCYAWQVERIEGSRVVDRSEPWSFCVKMIVEPSAMKYVRLDRLAPGSVYEAIDERIFFRYDELYATSAMECMILAADNFKVEPNLNNESGPEVKANVRSVGVNLFELDLEPYNLKPGSYDLVVMNGKGGKRKLRFRITR